MLRQKRSDTGPERVVRKILSALSQRYRLANRDLPGSPDLANRSRKWAVFVHGCYWHQHRGCPGATLPKRNRDWWKAKFRANRRRDAKKAKALEDEGFRVLTIWECETKDVRALGKRLARALSTRRPLPPPGRARHSPTRSRESFAPRRSRPRARRIPRA
ncbi:MAG: DNA mismatch endonuclease Vsr [Thermoanaerobaculia bacterium]|nr:DNA mismatch endonuclease Vsr [Thermoanaerobaculia bacterium]